MQMNSHNTQAWKPGKIVASVLIAVAMVMPPLYLMPEARVPVAAGVAIVGLLVLIVAVINAAGGGRILRS